MFTLYTPIDFISLVYKIGIYINTWYMFMTIKKLSLILALLILNLPCFAANPDSKVICSDPSDTVAAAVESLNEKIPANFTGYSASFHLSSPNIVYEAHNGANKTIACVSVFWAL